MRALLVIAVAALALLACSSGVDARSLHRVHQHAHHAHATADHTVAGCSFTAPDGAEFDFSSLASDDLVGSDGSYLRLCGVVDSPAAAECLQLNSSSSACMVTPGGYVWDFGDWSVTAPPKWSYIDEAKSGVQFTMQGAKQCWIDNGGKSPWFANVQLTCAAEQGNLTVSDTHPESCTVILALPTPLACWKPAPPTPTPTPPAPPVVACGMGRYDFSSLADADFNVTDASGRFSYYLRLCGSVQAPAASECQSVSTDTSACKIGNGVAHDVGNWNAGLPPKWTYIDDVDHSFGVMYSLTGQDQCWVPGVQHALPYVSFVILECARTAAPLQVMDLAVNAPCIVNFVLKTSLACPQ